MLAAMARLGISKAYASVTTPGFKAVQGLEEQRRLVARLNDYGECVPGCASPCFLFGARLCRRAALAARRRRPCRPAAARAPRRSAPWALPLPLSPDAAGFQLKSQLGGAAGYFASLPNIGG